MVEPPVWVASANGIMPAATPAAVLLAQSGSASALTDAQRLAAANKVDTDHDGKPNNSSRELDIDGDGSFQMNIQELATLQIGRASSRERV